MGTSLFSREENIAFWKNLILTAIFFTITPITLGISLFSLYSLQKAATESPLPKVSNILMYPQSGVKVYASLPTKIPSIDGQVGASDARTEILKQYMESYDSPLADYANLIVQAADKYSLDFRLLTAIAQQESNLCKIIPPGSFNCWGWGITGEGTLSFKSYDEGIETVSQGLRDNYLSKGYTSIDEIMSKYTPLSNGSWANGVNTFMSIMQ